MKRYRRLIDIAFVVLVIAILTLLLKAPPPTTPPLPLDKEHQANLAIAWKRGKKSAEKQCLECHNPEAIPNHPTGNRCLFCHRLPKKTNHSRIFYSEFLDNRT